MECKICNAVHHTDHCHVCGATEVFGMIVSRSSFLKLNRARGIEPVLITSKPTLRISRAIANSYIRHMEEAE